MKQQRSLTEGSIVQALVRLSVPIVLANILQTAYQITDTFWVGRLSAEAVAAVSLSFPINFLLIAIGGGLPIAGSVLIAQYKGKGDMVAMNRVAAQTLLMVLAVSIALTCLGYVFSEPIMRFMGAAPDVLPDAVRFLQITFLGFVFVFGFFVFQSLMRGLGVVQMPMYIVLVTVILNFFLDPLFIFGYGPVPAMGVSGAAMATLCTQALATLIGFIMLLRGNHGIHLGWSDFQPDWAFMRTAFRIGLPSSVEQATRALGLTVMTILVSGFGTITVAAYGIGIRILTFAIIPAMGLSMAATTLVGQNIGAGKIDRAARTNTIANILAFVSLTVLGGVLFLFAKPLSAFFVPQGGAAIDESAAFVRIMAFTFGCIGVQQVLTGSLRGAGDTTAAMALAVISQWIVQFPLAYVLALHAGYGPTGIWWSFAISNVVSAVITLLWFARGDWKHRRLLEEVELQERVLEAAQIEEGITS